jgi:hypothetical protein
LADGSDIGGEYIELINRATGPAATDTPNLTGWKFRQWRGLHFRVRLDRLGHDGDRGFLLGEFAELKL